jgi:hypothetical protein
MVDTVKALFESNNRTTRKRKPNTNSNTVVSPKEKQWACLASEGKFSHFIFTFPKNNQLQNIRTLYHINNFLLLFKLKKINTIQNFSLFHTKFFLLYITFIISYYYQKKKKSSSHSLARHTQYAK